MDGQSPPGAWDWCCSRPHQVQSVGSVSQNWKRSRSFPQRIRIEIIEVHHPFGLQEIYLEDLRSPSSNKPMFTPYLCSTEVALTESGALPYLQICRWLELLPPDSTSKRQHGCFLKKGISALRRTLQTLSISWAPNDGLTWLPFKKGQPKSSECWHKKLPFWDDEIDWLDFMKYLVGSNPANKARSVHFKLDFAAYVAALCCGMLQFHRFR